MPDIFNRGGNNNPSVPNVTAPPTAPPPTEPEPPAPSSVPDMNTSPSSFSFQDQKSANGVIPQPTVPFETISLQKVETVDRPAAPPPQTSMPTPDAGDIKLDVLREQEKPRESTPPSFLERFKEGEVPQDEKKSLEEVFSPSEAPRTPEKEPEKPVATERYKMPDLPQSSILAKLLPISLFLIVIGLAIFLGMKFLPQFAGQKKVELTWWGLWEDEKIVKPVIDAYQRQNPNVTIKYVEENKLEYRTRLQSSIARDQGPDIFRFHNTWLPMLTVELSPLPEDLKTKLNFTNTFYPTAYYDLVRSNKIYGIPLMFDGLSLIYNSDIFQNAGLPAPSSWDEVAEDAKKLTVMDEQQNIKVAGITLGNTNVENWSDILGAMLLQNGADPSLPTDTCAKEAIQYYVSFTTGNPKVWDDTMGNSLLAFANGKAAMTIGPSWEIFELKKMNPNLNFKVVLFPQIPGGKRYWASYWAEGVNAKSKNQKEAWDFLMFLSKKENLQMMYTEAAKSSKERLFGEIYPRIDMANLLQDDNLVAPFLTGAKEAKSWYLSGRTYDQGINDRIIKYYEDLINSLNKQEQTVDEALKTVSLGVAQVYKDYDLTIPASNPNCKATSP